VGENFGTIATCYSTGTATGNGDVGGLVGYNRSDITTSYSVSAVSGDWHVGGLVGNGFPARVIHSIWDIEISGQKESAGGMGLTTAEMMDPSIIGLNGFANDPNWILDTGQDYPRLTWEGTPGQIIAEPTVDWLEGEGTLEAPYRLVTADQLIMVSKASILWDKHFILGADIDLDPNLQGRQLFSQALIGIFSGVFNGNGQTISNLTIVGKSYLGLFGSLSYPGIISNLGLEAFDVNGLGDYVGGLVGYDYGNITACYSTGSISGERYVGGLVGYISTDEHDAIGHCYSECAVSGVSCVGGLVGRNGSLGTTFPPLAGEGEYWQSGGNIYGCYSVGSVSGETEVGGLVGENFGNIASSYSTGTVSGESSVGGLVGTNHEYWDWDDSSSACIVTQCFWDVETSGQATSDGGTGKTTTEMQTARTFLDAGWDFVDETANGTEDIWWILEGQDYPRLWWEVIPGN
jgi:hypothetical protein